MEHHGSIIFGVNPSNRMKQIFQEVRTMAVTAYQKMFEKIVEQPLEEMRRKDGICAKCPFGLSCKYEQRSDNCMNLLLEALHYS